MKTKIPFLDLELKNPLIAASGTFGFGEEFAEYYDIESLGGISYKGLTLDPRDGNEGIRVWETPAGMMNSVGLENPGGGRLRVRDLAANPRPQSCLRSQCGRQYPGDLPRGGPTPRGL